LDAILPLFFPIDPKRIGKIRSPGGYPPPHFPQSQRRTSLDPNVFVFPFPLQGNPFPSALRLRIGSGPPYPTCPLSTSPPNNRNNYNPPPGRAYTHGPPPLFRECCRRYFLPGEAGLAFDEDPLLLFSPPGPPTTAWDRGKVAWCFLFFSSVPKWNGSPFFCEQRVLSRGPPSPGEKGFPEGEVFTIFLSP